MELIETLTGRSVGKVTKLSPNKEQPQQLFKQYEVPSTFEGHGGY